MNELHHSICLCGWSFHNNTDEAYKCRTLQNSLNMPTQVRYKFQLKVSIVCMSVNISLFRL